MSRRDIGLASTLCLAKNSDTCFPMDHPINALAYKILNASLAHESAEPLKISKLSRRGFIAAAASLTSCAVAETPKPPASANAATQAVKTTANTAYRTPAVQGPNPRNPDMGMTHDFSKISGISFSRIQVSGNYVAMTFDDGPHPQNTPRLLDMLRARNIKATFYVIGRSVDAYPQILRRTVAEGHEIGNHSNSHPLLTKLSDEKLRAEVQLCQDAVVRAAGIKPITLRPPYGGLLQRQRELVHAEFGYPIILWSVDPLDWKRPGPSVVSSRIIAGANSGAIILAHDLHGQTVDAMPATLDNLLRRGFKFVTVSQLLAMKQEAAAAAGTAPATLATPAAVSPATP
jgi:peptidoglycan-N-acetylglucosamine deacetylase